MNLTIHAVSVIIVVVVLGGTAKANLFVGKAWMLFWRSFPLVLGVFVALTIEICTPVSTSAAEVVGTEITGVFVDVSRIHHDANSNGDTWDYIWTADDALYSFNCDGRGYGTKSQNVSFNFLKGDQWDALTGSNVNPMDYGKSTQAAPNASNWKVTGADSIDGTIYAFIAENWYGAQNAFGGEAPESYIRQSVTNMSLIKSADKGQTWTRDSQTNYDHPMWTSHKFSTAFFVKYGQDGGKTQQDNQNRYVYAISNNGYWNCGSEFYLGRVARSKIMNLNPTDWEFLSNGKWVTNPDDATPIPGFSNGRMKDTMGSPIWLAGIQKYVTVTWFDPGTTARWHYPENITFAFYQADHPWGPWSYIGEKSAGDFIADKRQRIHRWYGPSLSPKFVTYNPDGSVTVILTFSGQTWEDKPESLYKNNTLPVTFYTRPQPKEVETVNDSEAQYSEGWAHRQDTTAGDFRDDAHVTTTLGAYADFKFTGRGIEILSEKNTGMGAAEVLMDGVSQGTFALYQDPMPALYQVEFYRNMTLADGPHTVRVINRSENGKRCILDGFRVYGGTDFDPRAQYRIINRANGKALGGREGTAEVGQPDQHEGTALQWKMESVGGGFYRITNIQSGKVLATSEHASLGAPVNQHAVRDDPHSQWSISAVGNATFSIINRANDMGVSSTDTSVTNSVSLAWYLGRDDQKWEIVKVR